MVQPINYGALLAPTTPLDPSAFLQGAQAGQVIAGNIQNRQVAEAQMAQAQVQARLAQEAARAKAEADAARKADLARLADPSTPLADFARVTAKYPEISEGLKRSFDMLTAAERDTKYTVGARALSAVEAGDTETAAALLEEEAARNEASGRADDAKTYRLNAQAVRKVPTQARALIATFLASTDPEKFAKIEADIRSNPATVAKATAEVDYVKQQTQRLRDQTANEARRLRLDEKAFEESVQARIDANTRADIALSEKMQGIMTDSAITAEGKIAEATKAGEVASAFRAAERDTVSRVANEGIVGTGREIASRLAGTEGPMTQARLKYMQLVDEDIQRRAKESGNKLTDEDYRQQRKLYPDPEGNFGLIAKWAEDFEKKTKRAAAIDDAKAAWIGQNGSLGPARSPMLINGVVVGTGETLQDVMKKIATAPDAAPTASRRSGSGQALPSWAANYK